MDEGISSASDDYSFTIEQLRPKYRWFKKQWKQINNKIHSGSGLGAEDTQALDWYELLDPIFTESVYNMTKLSSKASDILSAGEERDSSGSDGEVSYAASC